MHETDTKNKIKEHLINDGLQYCQTRAGIEQMALFFQMSMKEKPEWDFYSMDAKNGFNNICRISGLNETRKHMPKLLPFLRLIYGKDATLLGFMVFQKVQSESNVKKDVSKETF